MMNDNEKSCGTCANCPGKELAMAIKSACDEVLSGCKAADEQPASPSKPSPGMSQARGMDDMESRWNKNDS